MSNTTDTSFLHYGVIKAGDLKRSLFEAQAVVGISGEIPAGNLKAGSDFDDSSVAIIANKSMRIAAEPHTSSAQIRGGLGLHYSDN